VGMYCLVLGSHTSRATGTEFSGRGVEPCITSNLIKLANGLGRQDFVDSLVCHTNMDGNLTFYKIDFGFLLGCEDIHG